MITLIDLYAFLDDYIFFHAPLSLPAFVLSKIEERAHHTPRKFIASSLDYHYHADVMPVYWLSLLMPILLKLWVVSL